MKGKKIQKIVEKATLKSIKKFKERSNKTQKLKAYQVEPEHNSFNELIFTNPSDEVVQRSKNLVLRVLTLRDKLNITINDSSIRLNADLNYLSKKQNTNKNLNYAVKDEWFCIDIMKNIGIIITLNDTKVAFKDQSFYDEIVSKISQIFHDINMKNFETIYNDVMVETGLARSSNLDDLISD
jgi:hypothetical protein